MFVYKLRAKRFIIFRLFVIQAIKKAQEVFLCNSKDLSFGLRLVASQIFKKKYS